MDKSPSHRWAARITAAAIAGVLAGALVGPVAVLAGTAGASAGSGATAKSATVHAVHSAKYGTILVTAGGKTLYILTADSPNKSSCSSSCAALWPPLTAKGKPAGGKGTRQRLLGSISRGTARQVTYDGHPLYTYAGDTGAGQVNGEGIASFGGTWYVLSASGSPVKGAATASKSSGGSGGGGGW